MSTLITLWKIFERRSLDNRVEAEEARKAQDDGDQRTGHEEPENRPAEYVFHLDSLLQFDDDVGGAIEEAAADVPQVGGQHV